MMNNGGNIRERCYHFSVAIVRFVRENRSSVHSALLDQLIRSATSIGANIVEGAAASSRKEFVRFYEYALRSANETKYWLSLIRDSYEVDPAKVNPLLDEGNQISKIIASSIIRLKQQI